eukprot:TRINITY_DN6661_c0_g1_i1.p1 TRINITY_DN6661_c0_g1~~TRINITY_DN6661_c0_g1_i1.p1  ORF type:complete len:185 (+),score=7.87 TRINITY_DN6661_c0_g1_i1:68-622(+)
MPVPLKLSGTDLFGEVLLRHQQSDWHPDDLEHVAIDVHSARSYEQGTRSVPVPETLAPPLHRPSFTPPIPIPVVVSSTQSPRQVFSPRHDDVQFLAVPRRQTRVRRRVYRMPDRDADNSRIRIETAADEAARRAAVNAMVRFPATASLASGFLPEYTHIRPRMRGMYTKLKQVLVTQYAPQVAY